MVETRNKENEENFITTRDVLKELGCEKHAELFEGHACRKHEEKWQQKQHHDECEKQTESRSWWDVCGW